MISPIPPPPQPQNLPSLTRLRVVQLENIASIADRALTSGDATETSATETSASADTMQPAECSNNGAASLSGELPVHVPTTNLIDLTDDSIVDTDEDPLYT